MMAVPAAKAATSQEVTDSINKIVELAKQGDADAQNTVGGWFYTGKHVEQNYNEAFRLWGLSAKQGNSLAIGNMGLCYQTGHGVEADSLKASKLYQKSIEKGNKALFNQQVEEAKKGNVFSSMFIAYCYQNGVGVKKDPKGAEPYLKIAADKNCLTAERDLAMLLLNDKRPGEAAPWFKKASGQGDVPSTFWLGRMLLQGMGVARNPEEGANYIMRAAEKGFPAAMLQLGECYEYGSGVAGNMEQAVKWYRKAAGKGVGKAQWALATCLREGNGTEQSYNQALTWYAEAVSNGFSKPFQKLINDTIPASPFVNYVKGIKTYMDKNYEAALAEFKVVEKAKIIDGKVMEAVIMANGNYTKNNLKKAVKTLKDAAKTNPQAMYILAGLYEAGKGVDKDMAQAVNLMTQAAALDYGQAICALGDMYYEGRGVARDYRIAVENYEKAYGMGSLTENAARRYAACYEDGLGGLTPDKEQAEKILKAARRTSLTDLLKLV